MNAIDLCVRIIPTLSKQEKKSFAVKAKTIQGQKRYVQLFKWIESGKAIQGLKSSWTDTMLISTATNLYSILMQVLREQRFANHLSSRFLNAMADIDLLIDMELLDQALNLSDKMVQLSRKFEQWEYSAWFLQKCLQIKMLISREGLNDEFILKSYQEIRTDIQKMQMIVEHASLYDVLNYYYNEMNRKDAFQDMEKLNFLLLSEINLANNPRYKSFEIQKKHWMFQSLYFLMIEDHKSFMNCYIQLEELFQQHQDKWLDMPSEYLELLGFIMKSLCEEKLFIDIKAYLTKIDLVEVKTTADMNIKNALLVLFGLKYFLLQEKFPEAYDFFKHKEQEILKSIKIYRLQYSYLIFSNIFYLCFKMKDYKRLRTWVNYFNFNFNYDLNNKQHRWCILLCVMVYAEMGEMEQAKSLNDSLSNFYKKTEVLEVELLIFRFFRNWTSKNHDLSSYFKTLKRYMIEMEQHFSSFKNKDFFYYFDYYSYFAAKLG